jgi:hypothetical protein
VRHDQVAVLSGWCDYAAMDRVKAVEHKLRGPTRSNEILKRARAFSHIRQHRSPAKVIFHFIEENRYRFGLWPIKKVRQFASPAYPLYSVLKRYASLINASAMRKSLLKPQIERDLISSM